MDFRIFVDDLFLNVDASFSATPNHNKYLLSLLNDFEDGRWRYPKFQSFVWDNVAETSLSFAERQNLVDRSHSALVRAAQNLRLVDGGDDFGRGSELAEIVLYGIMKHHHHALPVVPKIFYKQNTQDNAKGSDSVHIVVSDDGRFTLWLGEAKFYKSIEDARLHSIVSSVKSALQPDKLRKENAIIVGVGDLDAVDIPADTRAEIKRVLSQDSSLDIIKPRLNIPILLLHECGITARHQDMTGDYTTEILAFHTQRAHSYFAKQVDGLQEIFNYDKITFHLILFPVPSKDTIVGQFLGNIQHYRSQDDHV